MAGTDLTLFFTGNDRVYSYTLNKSRQWNTAFYVPWSDSDKKSNARATLDLMPSMPKLIITRLKRDLYKHHVSPKDRLRTYVTRTGQNATVPPLRRPTQDSLLL